MLMAVKPSTPIPMPRMVRAARSFRRVTSFIAFLVIAFIVPSSSGRHIQATLSPVGRVSQLNQPAVYELDSGGCACCQLAVVSNVDHGFTSHGQTFQEIKDVP